MFILLTHTCLVTAYIPHSVEAFLHACLPSRIWLLEECFV
jgi:hypothetical protein